MASGYSAFFAASGFRLTEAQSPDEGLEQAVALLPDLIVLDFGFDGELVARLRGNVATSAIPIIALTDMCRLGKLRELTMNTAPCPGYWSSTTCARYARCSDAS